MTTVRPAKRLKPSDAEERPEPPVIQEKTPAHVITAPQVHQGGIQADVETPVSMCCGERTEEEGSHTEPSQATTAELEGAAHSGEGGKHGENGARSASGDDEAEDDAASAESWATLEDTVAAESGTEGVSGDGKDDRPAAYKESQAERKPSLKGKSTPGTSTAVRGT
ncbi:hypothetical protein HPB51_003268 [Rhipicephalus microplus]|uniref:Uncharacterized protein n=1 Tax=Rhipicephalus microplus TaxID=6941 RepID=A0A9J6EXT5_RHIMP|nr:hypothetical protein HPB51_003268 [Rhipicephalus microplus]